ncbi:hypothetical protein [Naasia aerilata]|uniref:Uncharacterized protein n=1 Tax=Naasia aerilata TaxID=1162966 RepID=A0ABN6XN54_9MICO|nr:hypothetical protein [Naasia aerilata]BDZ45065.1 hypothetical protein GCM10025866_09740 [Naasia aerilata]
MSGRTLAEPLAAAGITLVLLFLGAGLLALGTAESALDAFFRSGPASVVGILGVAVLLWIVLLLVAAAVNRSRSPVVRLVTDTLLTLLVGGAALAFWAAFAAAVGGFGDLVVGIAVVDVALFCGAALIALVLTHLVLFRRTPPAPAAVA